MRFWRRDSYVELLFEADNAPTDPPPADAPSTIAAMPSRSSPTSSSTGGSSFLAQDPMHTSDAIVCPDPAGEPTSTSEGGESAHGTLYIGDVVVDEEGAEWIVRNCFCGSAGCNNQALKRIDGKDELDVWDRGKPRSL